LPLPELETHLRDLLKDPATVPAFADLLFPNVIGHSDVKIGLLAMMTSQWDAPNERQRIHILLHGKPGTGKSALMFPLERNWEAKYISSSPTAASLKMDARRKDRGAQIFTKNDGNIICLDDIELFADMDSSLRDIMERGFFSDNKGGADTEYPARCRILAATNDIRKMSLPIISRFDLIFNFNFPTVSNSLDIVHQILNNSEEDVEYLPMLQHYIFLTRNHKPVTIEKEKIENQFKIYFEKHGLPHEDGGQTGKEGRWISTIMRLATARARMVLGNVGPAEISFALENKYNSDKIIG